MFEWLFRLSLRVNREHVMVKILVLGILISFIAVLLLGVRVFFTKKGEFPSLHIGSSRAMQDRGIHCASCRMRKCITERTCWRKYRNPKINKSHKKNEEFYSLHRQRSVGGSINYSLHLVFFNSNQSSNGASGKNLSLLLNDSSVTLPIAFVNVDSLLMNYNFAKDLNESLLRKEESTRATLNQRQGQINSAAQEFDRKLRNNAFLSQERAQQEQERILQMNQEYQQLAERLTQEFMIEQEKLNLQMEDTIKARMKEFNMNKNYEIILSNRTTSTILFADDKYDITDDVVEFLNSKYGPATSTTTPQVKK